VGRLLEYKRFDLIIDACLQGNFNLKIVGAGRMELSLRAQAKESRNIEFLPFQTDEKLADLYQNAKAFIMANEEDFGMVMAETLTYGTPVIAYGLGGALEIVLGQEVRSKKQEVRGGSVEVRSMTQEVRGNGVLFEEQTPESLLGAIHKFESMNFDREAIKKSAERFSESHFHSAVLRAVDKLMGKN
jgi:glycosyltransferase involved in cell wall biosynthesis